MSLYKVDVPACSGKLFLAARPRGGEWLEDEVVAWKQLGVCTVVSLLTFEEELQLEIRLEEAYVSGAGMHFISFPIEDRQVPGNKEKFNVVLEQIQSSLRTGNKTLVHCRQGIGRTGLVAACLLIRSGVEAAQALALLSKVRGLDVPETAGQRSWVLSYLCCT